MDEPGIRARYRADREERKGPRVAYADPSPLGPSADEESRQELEEKLTIPEAEGITGYKEPNYRPPFTVPDEQIPGAPQSGEGIQGTESAPGPAKQSGQPKQTRMKPHLQFMVGPLLRYDTVDPQSGIWHGFAMIVTNDNGSSYATTPSLTLRYRSAPSQSLESDFDRKASLSSSSKSGTTKVDGQNIFVYHASHGGNTFWRFKLEVHLADVEQPVAYSINGGAELQFWVPGRNQNMRWMGHSCNGFSSGVKTEDFNGPSPLWKDFLQAHAKHPFHVVVGGGDQIYCDPMVKEPELGEWITNKDEKWKAQAPLTDAMKYAMDRFFFNHYVTWFRNGDFARTIACVPMMNMLDDHDLIDGFGSYPDELQSSPVFSAIGGRGYFWYLLFQNFIVDEVDGTSREPGGHSNRSMIIGGDAAFIPTVSHNFLSWLGPNQALLLLDCRAERRKYRICSEETYERVFARIKQLPATVKQLTILLGVPIAYPRMNFAEGFLESKLNPLVAIAKTGSLGLGGFVNHFNGQAELLDDLSDHWTAGDHKKERNWLIEQCQILARAGHLRITFLSGDVHAGGVGRLHDKNKIAPEDDPKYMLNIISSAIVNTPPPPAVITMVNKLGAKTHKTMWYCDTDEDMVDMWAIGTDEKSQKNKLIIGKRNYVTARYLEDTGELEWVFRVEKVQGGGETKGYPIKSPAVRY